MTTGSAAPRRRLTELDGLRGLAALSVLCFHAWLYTQPRVSAASRESTWEYVVGEMRLGLVLFFVLSGFLLYGPWIAAALGERPRPALWSYLRRRGARVLPAYYLALVGSIALLWGATGTPGVRLPSAGELPLFAVFAQNYFDHPLMTLDPPMWTLVIEVSFYLALPLIGAAALALRGGRARQALVPLVLVVAGVWWNRHISTMADPGPLAKILPAMLPYFALGMLAALVVHGRRVPRGLSLALLALGLAAVGYDAVWHATAATRGSHDLSLRIWRDLPAAAGFAALIAVAANGTGWLARLPGARPLVALGTVSYGVYLWHVPVLLFLRRTGTLPLSFVPALALALALTLVIATLSWRFVERPVLERAARRRRQRVPAAPAARPKPAPARTREPALSRSSA
jgi:peptidoglycan/LPS O-acetylase OafA/YrhL